MNSLERLKQQINRIDKHDYCEYQSIIGRYDYPSYILYIDQIPKDPYAPSHTGVYRVRIKMEDTGFTNDMITPHIRKIALRDYLARKFYSNCSSISKGRRGTGNSGIITISKPGQTILDRSSVIITDEYLEVRFFMGLPALERNINAGIAGIMLFDELPEIVRLSLFTNSLELQDVYRHLEVAEDTEYLRNFLKSNGLIGFVGDGSVLPRLSGVDDRPLPVDKAVVFHSPESMRMEFNLPNKGKISGMYIKEGITLIVGGGYHGKSTLLNALELGIYNHIPGDGREFCVTLEESVKIRASSGRNVSNVDISLFLNNMPLKIDTKSFSTENASGSTSQAATIIESIESGAKILLMDEDTCAANFMIRDKRMQELVSKEEEPITSFIDCVKYIYESLGISTILVMGGSGDYFDVSDYVIQMKDFLPLDVTLNAHNVAMNYPTNRTKELSEVSFETSRRIPVGDDLSPYNEYNKLRISAPNINQLIFGKNTVDLSDIEQLVENAQTKAIGLAIYSLLSDMNGTNKVADLIQKIMLEVNERGIDALDEDNRGDLAIFRGIELAATINRMRGLKVINCI